MKEKLETVSIVMPILNEQYYIKKVIQSILSQNYDLSKIEILFVDGMSKDNTVQIIKKSFENQKVDYKILFNNKKITPVSMNIGIKEAKNDIIIRMDAHSEYPENYVSRCVYYLNTVDAENVGCCSITKGEGRVGKAIASVVSSKFGVGNSQFRTSTKSGYVDTVPYGTFRKTLFDKIGYFNEELIRSEDNEINYRIIKNGGKVYLFNDIGVIYHPRNKISQLCKMAFQNRGMGYIYKFYNSRSYETKAFYTISVCLRIIYRNNSSSITNKIFNNLLCTRNFMLYYAGFNFYNKIH